MADKGERRKLAKRDRAKHGHYCWDWDGLWIDEYDEEYAACTCFKDGRKGGIGGEV